MSMETIYGKILFKTENKKTIEIPVVFYSFANRLTLLILSLANLLILHKHERCISTPDIPEGPKGLSMEK